MAIKNIGIIRKKIDIKMKNKLEDSTLLKEIAELVVYNIKGYTRKGKTMVTDGNLKTLEKSTIKNRKYLAKNNPTHPSFKPPKSNLTITGQLLDALVYRIKTVGSKITIYFNNNIRKPYKGNKGQPISKTITNYDLYKHLKRDRPVLDTNEKLSKQIVQRVKRFLRRSI